MKTESWVETRHGRIALTSSDGDGPPVLFIHGNSSCKEVFRHQLENFGARYRILAMDLPGHGRSDDAKDPQATYTQPSYAEAAIDVLDACDAKHAAVVGWSLGGHIGIEMIARRPEIAGLVVTGTPPCGPGTKSVNSAFTPLPHMAFTSKEIFTAEDSATYARYTLGEGAIVEADFVAAVARSDGRARRIMWDHWTEQEQGVNQIEILRDWGSNVAIIQGRDEPFFDLSYFERLAKSSLWRGAVHVVDDAGHAPFWEQPDHFNGLLDQFLHDVHHSR